MRQDRKTIAISEIVKIIEECRYNDELAEGYKREILDQETWWTLGFVVLFSWWLWSNYLKDKIKKMNFYFCWKRTLSLVCALIG